MHFIKFFSCFLRSTFNARKNPDTVLDDLAYRALRKDDNFENPDSLGIVKDPNRDIIPSRFDIWFFYQFIQFSSVHICRYHISHKISEILGMKYFCWFQEGVTKARIEPRSFRRGEICTTPTFYKSNMYCNLWMSFNVSTL